MVDDKYWNKKKSVGDKNEKLAERKWGKIGQTHLLDYNESPERQRRGEDMEVAIGPRGEKILIISCKSRDDGGTDFCIEVDVINPVFYTTPKGAVKVVKWDQLIRQHFETIDYVEFLWPGEKMPSTYSAPLLTHFIETGELRPVEVWRNNKDTKQICAYYNREEVKRVMQRFVNWKKVDKIRVKKAIPRMH